MIRGVTAVTSPPGPSAPTTAPTAAPAAAAPARAAAVLAVVVALVGAVLGPTGRFDALLGNGVTVASGAVEVLEDDAWVPAPVGRALAVGQVVRVPDGVATLDVPGGAVDLVAGTRLTLDRPLVLDTGSMVVRSDQVAAGDGVVTATGRGPWRLDATGRVGAYGGAPLLTDASGRETLVRPLQEVRVADGVVEGSPRPYVYVGSDVLDRQHLAPALDVDDYVASLRRGLAADYGTAPQSRDFYRDFAGLQGERVTTLEDIGFERTAGRVGPPADVLVAGVVTDALVTDAGLTPRAAGTEVRTKRVAGATWGLIAQARELDAGHVRAAADRALSRREQQEAEGTATPVFPPAPTGPTATTRADDAGGDGAGSPDGPTTPDAPGGGEDDDPSDPSTDDGEGPVGGVVDETGATELLPEPLGDTVDDTVDVVDDVLEPITGSSTSSSSGDDEDLLDGAGDLVGETVDAVDDTVSGLLGGD